MELASLYSGGQGSYGTSFGNIKIGYDYIAPELIYSGVADKLKVHLTLGFGYYCHKEKYYKITDIFGTFGSHFNLGFDYMINENFALGAEAQSLTAVYGKNSKLSVNDQAARISRINIYATLKHYF